MNYNGEKCFSCGNVFNNEDDVVVCPDCGTPYHRECYKQNGECINHALHENGGSWQREIKEEKSSSEPKITAVLCPRCRCINQPDAQSCIKCGYPIAEYIKVRANAENNATSHTTFGGDTANAQYLGFNPNEDFGGGARLKEITQYVDSNAIYYIPIFKRMKEAGTKISFNLICLFFPYYYFANRKMWLWALLTAAITMLLDIPSLIYLIGEEGAAMPIAVMQSISQKINENSHIFKTLVTFSDILNWFLRIACCLFSNWLYMRHSIRAINKVKAFYGGPVSPARLRSMGGTQPVNILIMAAISMGLAFIVYVGVIFVLMLLQQMGIM